MLILFTAGYSYPVRHPVPTVHGQRRPAPTAGTQIKTPADTQVPICM